MQTFSRTFSLYFFKPQRLKYQLLRFQVHDVIKHFSVPFETTTFAILVTCFPSSWHSKTFPVLFLSYFFKPQRLKYQLLAFLVHDVIKHFPVLFQMTTYEISVTCCYSTWLNKNIIPYTFPVFFQTQRLKYQLVAFLVHDVMKTFSCTFSNHNRLKYQFLAIQVHDVIQTFSPTFSL